MLENTNPKHNPATSGLGVLFMFISIAMYSIKYILPAFMTLKNDVSYDWYAPMIPLSLGLILLFMTDDYFAQIFGIGKKIIEKKTGTDEQK